jgi:thioredoxin 1
MGESKHVITANDIDFDEVVLQSDKPVLLELTGAWCPPCQRLAPIVAKIAEEKAGEVKVVAVDIDASPGVGRRLGIRAVPTTVAFTGGAEKGRIVGLTTRERLLEMLRGAARAPETSHQRPTL